MRSIKASLCLVLLVLLAGGCLEENKRRVEFYPGPAVFVVNSLSETLSRIRLDNGTVIRDALVLGSSPNAIMVDGDDGSRGYAVNSLTNDIWLIDLDNVIQIDAIDLGPGASPYALELVNGALYISSFESDEVARLDLGSGDVERRVAAGRGPEGLLFVPDGAGDPDRGTLYVAATGYTDQGYRPGEVVCVSVPADTVRHRITVGINPQKLALAPDGTIHVVCTGDYGAREGKVFVIDGERLAVIDSVAIGGSPAAVLVLESGLGVTAGYYGGLRYYDRSTGAVVESRALSGNEGLSALAQDSTSGRVLLYVADFDDSVVHVVDVAADSLVTSYPTGHGPVDLAVRR